MRRGAWYRLAMSTTDPAAALRSIARLSARDRSLISARAGRGAAMAEGADKVRALVDVAATLDAVGARYALVGGVAVGLHARVPRATVDTDLAVHTSHRGGALTRALVAAGFELRGEHEHSVNFRHSSGEPVQLAFDRSFDPMIGRAESFEIDGARIAVVTREDLIAMKERAAADPGLRPSKALRDRADVALLLGDVPDEDEGW